MSCLGNMDWVGKHCAKPRTHGIKKAISTENLPFVVHNIKLLDMLFWVQVPVHGPSACNCLQNT